MSPPCIVLHYIMVAILRVELSLLHLPLTSRGKGSHAILRLGTRSPANSHIEAHSQELDNDSCNHVHYDRLPTRCLDGCSSTVRSVLQYGGSSWNRTTEVPSLFTRPELVGNRTHIPLHLRPVYNKLSVLACYYAKGSFGLTISGVPRHFTKTCTTVFHYSLLSSYRGV